MSAFTIPSHISIPVEDVEKMVLRASMMLGQLVPTDYTSAVVWLEMIRSHLPPGFVATPAHVVSSNGAFSDHLDVVVVDIRCPIRKFYFSNKLVIPVESVCAVFEARKTISAESILSTRHKVAKVRGLLSMGPVLHDRCSPSTSPRYIFGGIVTLNNDFDADASFLADLPNSTEWTKIDFGCVANKGIFATMGEGRMKFSATEQPTLAFLRELVRQLSVTSVKFEINERPYRGWLDVDDSVYLE